MEPLKKYIFIYDWPVEIQWILKPQIRPVPPATQREQSGLQAGSFNTWIDSLIHYLIDSLIHWLIDWIKEKI